MIQTLNTLSLIFAILAVVMVVISAMIFFNWKIRDVRGYLTGKTKADVLANLREETDSQKRYAMNTEMFTSQISVSSSEDSQEEKQREKSHHKKRNIDPETTQFTTVVVENESEVKQATQNEVATSSDDEEAHQEDTNSFDDFTKASAFDSETSMISEGK